MKSLSLALVALGVSASAILSVAIGQTAAQPSSSASTYTEEQAIRGQSLYYYNCLACHGDTLAGLDKAPPLAGPEFSGVWQGEPLMALVDRIGAMPPDKPGSLSRSENVDILAYILWYNGFPIGDKPLGTARDFLAETTFQTPLPTGQ